jgi:inorganic pyrophosphatase
MNEGSFVFLKSTLIYIDFTNSLPIPRTNSYVPLLLFLPRLQLAGSCKNGGAATNIIYGLALGYLSTIIPILILASVVFTSFTLCDTYVLRTRIWRTLHLSL